MDALLQRVWGLATAAMPFAVRDGEAPVDANRPAIRIPPAARWALWLTLLIMPGSFLLLAVLLWGGRTRSPQLRSLLRP